MSNEGMILCNQECFCEGYENPFNKHKNFEIFVLNIKMIIKQELKVLKKIRIEILDKQ